IGEAPHRGLAQWDIEIPGDGFSQHPIGVASKNLHQEFPEMSRTSGLLACSRDNASRVWCPAVKSCRKSGRKAPDQPRPAAHCANSSIVRWPMLSIVAALTEDQPSGLEPGDDC